MYYFFWSKIVISFITCCILRLRILGFWHVKWSKSAESVKALRLTPCTSTGPAHTGTLPSKLRVLRRCRIHNRRQSHIRGFPSTLRVSRLLTEWKEPSSRVCRSLEEKLRTRICRRPPRAWSSTVTNPVLTMMSSFSLSRSLKAHGSSVLMGL